jgi:hypothetical protein
MVDGDCGGLTCILPSIDDEVFGGGPAGGYCTKACSADGDCGMSGVCYTNAAATTGRCVLTCVQGPALMHLNDPIDDPTKCLARPDVACDQLGPNRFACLPVCGSDSQCPAGMHCDPRASVCVSTPNPGLADGQACGTLDGGVDPCAGECLTLAPGGDAGATVSVCTTECVMGDAPSVAATPTAWTVCGGVTNGLCVYSPPGEGAGDLGYCTNACQKQDDCDAPDLWCFAIVNLTGTSGITNGWCFPGTPCPGGTADCTASGFQGSVCTQTAYGPWCISSQFPLGSAAPDGG